MEYTQIPGVFQTYYTILRRTDPSVRRFFAPFCIFPIILPKISPKGGIAMKEEEKKPIPWEISDPKPPVIRSGHLENKK